MDKKLRETTNLCVEIMNRKRQVKGKLGHVVQIGIAVRRKHDACIRMAMLRLNVETILATFQEN